MSNKKLTQAFIKTAQCFYGGGMIGIGIQQFIYADFRPVIFPPLPAFLHIPVLAYITGALLIIAGVLLCIGIKAKITSLWLGAFLLVLFIVFQCTYVLFLQPYSPHHLGLWTDPLKELALSGGAFVMAGLSGNALAVGERSFFTRLLERFIWIGRILFCTTITLFGLDHFYYPDFVSTLVPLWIPGSMFWTYFAGVALMASGITIILKIWIKPAALLLSAMLFLWLILLHIPRANTDPYTADGNEITSVFEALAFSGIALGIACIKRNEEELNRR